MMLLKKSGEHEVILTSRSARDNVKEGKKYSSSTEDSPGKIYDLNCMFDGNKFHKGSLAIRTVHAHIMRHDVLIGSL